MGLTCYQTWRQEILKQTTSSTLYVLAQKNYSKQRVSMTHRAKPGHFCTFFKFHAIAFLLSIVKEWIAKVSTFCDDIYGVIVLCTVETEINSICIATIRQINYRHLLI